MKVNLGCGDRYVEGWVNVDHASCPHRVDVVADLTRGLPWERGSLSRIYAGHLFEHITPGQCKQLLKRLYACADPGGCAFVAVGPDVDVAERMIADGTFDHSWGTLDDIKHGAGRWAGDVHKWETTGPKIADLLCDTGWSYVTVTPIDQFGDEWPIADRAQKWQYAIHAWRGPVTVRNKRGVFAVMEL